ncbi:DNA recombination protein RmuC [Azonexus sp.]|jgi:DNA recombination protein RmuC|uniref:DNA recombination protein RmuC n=1 Tax=Azonexus sp. TaxID=1872668 RepID=UPI0028185EE8|nr:DNA recombination protein RmuC [Azonexus sp.]MDR1994380.1 DNA recombination protein RmuC [Azonexus sp.]
MSETVGLVLAAGMGVVILLQAVTLWRGRAADAARARLDVLRVALEQGLARLERELREELARGRREDAEAAFRDREERAQSATLLSQAVTTQVGQFGALQAERLEAFARELGRFSLGLDERFERLKQSVEGRLAAIQADNANKLEEMRRTVDEKLHATLEQRLGESFKLVSERLEQVHRGLGEMQSLAAGVGDLKRVLTNVKTRGTWGEVQLSALLEQLLTAEQFAANVATRPGGSERVDFAIRLPGKDDGAVVWLPIDAKFPIEDYQRLLEAQERGDPVAVEEAAKAVETRLRNEARSIRDKYVAPPHTTDFALLYLPVEGLYAEALRRPGLAEALQRDFRVSLAGPTTLAAMLNSLQMGFRTLAIEQRSAEVWAVLGAVKTEFGKFGEVLAHTRKKLDEASNSIGKAETRTRQLSRKLKEVEALPAGVAEQLIGVADLDGGDDE